MGSLDREPPSCEAPRQPTIHTYTYSDHHVFLKALENKYLKIYKFEGLAYFCIQIQIDQLLILTEKFLPLPGFEPGTLGTKPICY